MKKVLFILTLLTLISFPCLALQVCFLEHGGSPNLRIYVTQDRYLADVCVYFTDSEQAAANNTCIWYKTNDMQADKRFLIVNHRTDADLTILFVDNKAFAQWINYDKKKLLD
ncbi:MAG: DUF6150 family protein [Bacillota bacterium]